MTKTEARRVARERLRGMPGAQRAAAGEQIAERLPHVPEIEAARTILLYSALPEEVPTVELARVFRRGGKRIVYPRCLPHRQLALHLVDEEGMLAAAGSYGILEPAPDCPLVAVEEIDVVVVPGLAWDRRGTRLGRGAGYYDRLFALSELTATRCGVFFALQELPELPADPWDVAMELIVTEAETLRVPASG